MSLQSDRGFATALVLWMIAGMSLLVAAVIHFARDDIGMAELRINEAKSQAFARGIALLAIRDQKREAFSLVYNGSDEGAEEKMTNSVGAKNTGYQGVFTRDYNLEGIASNATIYPANALVSLNSSPEEELFILVNAIGKPVDNRASIIARGIVDYRNQKSSSSSSSANTSTGFRFREELLAVEGMTRNIYDRIKFYVHPYQSDGLHVQAAPDPLKNIFSNAGIADDKASKDYARQSADQTSPIDHAELTFDTMYQGRTKIAQYTNPIVVMVKMRLTNGTRLRQSVWVDQSGTEVLRIHDPVLNSSLD